MGERATGHAGWSSTIAASRPEIGESLPSPFVLARADDAKRLRKGRKAPTADAGGPYTGSVDRAIDFDGSGSSDPNGDALTHSWHFGDGSTAVGMRPTHRYSEPGKYVATLTVSDGRFHRQAEAPVTIDAEASEEPPPGEEPLPAPEADSSFDCLEQPGPLEVVSGSFGAEKFEPETAPHKKFDARSARFEIPETISHSMIALRGDDTDGGMCWAGGFVTASPRWHDLDISWEESKHGYDNSDSDRGEMENTAATGSHQDRMTWTGMHIYNVHDGIRTNNAFDDWRIQHVWLDYIRDDCVENDHIHSGEIYDSLFDGCYSGFSARPSSSGTGAETTIRMDRVLMRMEPMPYPHRSATVLTQPGYGDTPFGNGNTFKLDDGNEPTFEITNSIFLHEYDSEKQLFPPADKVSVCRDNTLIWYGDLAAAPTHLLDDFPGCFTLITDLAEGEAVWKEAVEDWHLRHPEVGAHRKPLAPGEYVWPRYLE
jgi:PKD repeat protein